MKRLPLLATALLCMSLFAALSWAGDVPSASTEVYDIANYGDELLELFYKAEQQGRRYPTDEAFEAAGFNLMDIAFVRSHTRKRDIMVDKSKNINSSATDNRQLWLNVPMGIGKNQGGYPSANFSDDVFSMWNYVNLFGSWNHPLFRAAGVWVDAAHKNGTDIFSGIKFFESWGTGDGSWVKYITTKNADGSFRYAHALINCLMYFGSDGINYNWEDTSYKRDDVIAFHQELQRIAAAEGFTNYHSGIYTSDHALNDGNVEALYGSAENGRTHDVMLNYMSGDFTSTTNMANSVNYAKKVSGSAEGLYAGVWFVTMNRSWNNLVSNANTKKIGVCLWGEHSQSRFFSYCAGNSSIEFQENYQKMLERAFSGGNRNPAKRPKAVSGASAGIAWEGKTPLGNFQGLAEYIPERTAVDGMLPFVTYFNLGNGERYHYKGRKTMGPWYNMGAQDIVPTYRWLVYKTNTTTPTMDVLPEFTHSDAYTGGSCLRIVATKQTDSDIILYRTHLRISDVNPVARIALKNGLPEGGAPGLSVIVRLKDDPYWYEVPCEDLSSDQWEEQTLPFDELGTGDVIEYIGLRTTGDANGLLVGKLEISDNRRVAPASISSAVAEVKEESQASLSVKLRWTVDAPAQTRADWDLLYNDEANIDHFEVMLKDGPEGRVSEVARTSSWSAYVGHIALDADSDPWVGVRAASVDGKSFSPVVWVQIPRAEPSLLPERSASDAEYPSIEISTDADGYQTAIQQRYITSLKTEDAVDNITYTASKPVADGSQYLLADQVLTVRQGQDVKVTFRVADKDDGLIYCTARAYADWDGDHFFNATNDELLWEGGADQCRCAQPKFATGQDFLFYVPEDAMPGNSRFRMVFSDAWFAHPGPAGKTQKGFAIDFPLVITGNNPGREAAADTHDAGVADEPEDLSATAIRLTTLPAVSSAVGVRGGVYVSSTEKAWIYDAAGHFIRFVEGLKEETTFVPLPDGQTYIVRMQRGHVIRNNKVLVP